MNTLDDTIVAIATAPGEGAIGVVRLSGRQAGEFGNSVLVGAEGLSVPFTGRGVHWAWVVDPRTGRAVDEVLALWMPGPGSYTREDVLEIQCHGGGAAGKAVLDLLLAQGARLADPGEFTLRAYLRGRIDLVQAEAVLDVIRAQTGDALRVHEELLRGRLSGEVSDWQQSLGQALARVEAWLDFGEEDVGELREEQVESLLRGVMGAMEEKLGSYAWGRTAREGFRVVLVGPPNTGKSSLLNRLAEGEHAIVSSVPGTTRDVIEVQMNAMGVPVRLVDTAGLRVVVDEVEEEGVRRARSMAAGGDLVVWVCDGSRALSAAEGEEMKSLIGSGKVLGVVNKEDLGRVPLEEVRTGFGADPIVVSAHTGKGLGDLLNAIREAAWSGGAPTGEAALTRERHRAAVERALGSVRRSLALLKGGGYPELVAREIQGGRGALGELLGWGGVDDVLESIFSEFCIGK